MTIDVFSSDFLIDRLTEREIVIPHVMETGTRVPALRNTTSHIYGGIIKRLSPKRALEIGTAQGYSTLLLLLNAPDSVINTVDVSATAQEGARTNAKEYGLLGRINFICANATEAIPLMTGRYDFILLDGAKSQYAQLLPYLIDLLDVGGALVCDNVNYFGLASIAETLPNNHKHITIARNMERFLHMLTHDARLRTRIYDVEDGLSLSIKISD